MKMFDRKDYLGWLAGAIVLAGLLVNPLLYMLFRKIGYLDSLPPSLVVSFLIAISATRNGSISWLQFLLGLAIIFAIWHFYYIRTGVLFEMGGGILMFTITCLCAMAGAEGSRAYRELREHY